MARIVPVGNVLLAGTPPKLEPAAGSACNLPELSSRLVSVVGFGEVCPARLAGTVSTVEFHRVNAEPAMPVSRGRREGNGRVSHKVEPSAF